ncbi:MAG: hypothetical protein ACFBSG_21210 [Leptolyngbyaceae cyanobacterium]
MERGLLWLPLLGVFAWLAWAGWNEYQKLEGYKQWAGQFDRAKYDIYAALGQTRDRLVWGQPTRQGLDQPQEISLTDIKQIVLISPVGPQPAAATASALPRGCDTALKLTAHTDEQYWIPFTDADLAAAWHQRLQSCLEALQSTPQP